MAPRKQRWQVTTYHGRDAAGRSQYGDLKHFTVADDFDDAGIDRVVDDVMGRLKNRKSVLAMIAHDLVCWMSCWYDEPDHCVNLSGANTSTVRRESVVDRTKCRALVRKCFRREVQLARTRLKGVEQ